MLKASNNVLIIFVKYPQAGRVKTRLAKHIGKQKAADLYRLFTEAVLKRTKDKNFRRLIFYTPPDKEKEIKKWLGSDGLEFRPQRGRGLGERLFNAFRLALGSSSARRVAAIGTDSPLIDRKVINNAFKALETKQCVLGPALDGGYYLIGLSSFNKEVFKGIDWGTRKVFKQTIAKLRRLNISHSFLDTSFDVDTHRDVSSLKQELRDISQKNHLNKISNFLLDIG